MSLTLRKKQGSPFWYARGTIEARQADGSIGRVRIEESTRSKSKARAREIADDIERHYHDLAYGKIAKRGPTFAAAALTYIQTRGRSDRFVTKLIKFFGSTPIGEIDQAAVARACQILYPAGSASTHNRAVYAPVITILRLSGVRPDLRRPKIQRTQINIPMEGWFDAVLPHCPAQLAALLTFITLTGRRITEALEATYNGDGTVTIGRTKTNVPLVVNIPGVVVSLLDGYPLSAGCRMFPYGDRHNVYRELRKACKRAGVPYYGTHAIGRHSFATRLIREGYSTFTVARMGGWASTRMVDYHYGHLAHDETQELLKQEQERWSKKRT